MHVLAIFLAGTFWSALPVKVVGVAGFVYVLVQALKAIFPTLGGWYSIALNVAFSVTALISVAQPGDLKTPQFWAGLMLAIASAAGIHGTVKSAMAGMQPALADVAAQPKGTQSAADPQVLAKMSVLAIALLLGGLGLTGCAGAFQGGTTPGATTTAPALPSGAVDKADATAYQTLKPAHDFAESISVDIVNGKLHPTHTQVVAMESLNRALNVADHAEQIYHNAGGGSTAAMSAAITGVLNAWASTQAALLATAAN
jgi:hypothetical protein